MYDAAEQNCVATGTKQIYLDVTDSSSVGSGSESDTNLARTPVSSSSVLHEYSLLYEITTACLITTTTTTMSITQEQLHMHVYLDYRYLIGVKLEECTVYYMYYLLFSCVVLYGFSILCTFDCFFAYLYGLI